LTNIPPNQFLSAKQAYIANLTSQIAKIKPYNGPDKDSIRNAGKPSSGAYNAARPAKTDTVARRLVQGALGLRVRRTPEQIAEEKALVQAAKGSCTNALFWEYFLRWVGGALTATTFTFFLPLHNPLIEAREAQRQEQQKQRQEMDAIFNS